MLTRVHAVILAGGGGTRLWPMSRRTKPKQVLRLFGDRSLFAAAVDRLRPWLETDRILIAAPAGMAEVLLEEVPDLPRGRFLVEPEPRGTAPVLGLAAVHIRRNDPDAVMAVLTSDHLIGRPDRLRSLLEAGAKLAAGGSLVTLGIPPESADTGYGYIRRGQAMEPVDGERAFQVLEFKEKPDSATAQAYLRSGEYYWNSGMFVWRPQDLLEEIGRSMPELDRVLRQAEADPRAEAGAEFLRGWSDLGPQTIDYGIMEHARRVAVMDATGLEWSDVGDWDRVFRLVAAETADNAARGVRLVAEESTGNLVIGGPVDRLVVLAGVHDLAVIDAGDVLLICRRDQAGRVRQVVEVLERDGLDQYLD